MKTRNFLILFVVLVTGCLTAGSSISVIPTTLSITVGETGTCTIRNGTSPYSASSSNTSVSTVSVSASTLSVTGVSAGSATIAVSDSGSDSVTVAVTVTESVSVVSTVDLPKTGQETCYGTDGNEMPCEGTGQDGDIQAGVVWPESRFTDNGDWTITDQLTGLMWTKAANIAQGTWQEALDYVAGMNAGTYENFGYTGWRLPNIKDIESLIDAGQHNPALPSDHPFVGVQGATGNYFFWSSTTESLQSVGSPSETAYTLNLAYGYSYRSKKKYPNLNSIWPVRSEKLGVIQLPKTGQTTCWDSEGDTISCNGTGQDGDLRVGVAWPDPRFTDNGDGTVTDNLTSLMWTKDANPPDERLTWQEALDYIAEMNKGNHQNFGYTDWRLPNRKEFQSLADYQDWLPSLPVNHPFTNLGGYPHHTSTSNAGDPASACVFCVWGGHVSCFYDKSDEDYTWPVRGGQYDLY